MPQLAAEASTQELSQAPVHFCNKRVQFQSTHIQSSKSRINTRIGEETVAFYFVKYVFDIFSITSTPNHF